MFNTNIVSEVEDKKSSYAIILNQVNEYKRNSKYLVQSYLLNKVYLFANLQEALGWLEDNKFERLREGVGIDIYTLKKLPEFTATLVRAGSAENNGNICPFYELESQFGTMEKAEY